MGYQFITRHLFASMPKFEKTLLNFKEAFYQDNVESLLKYHSKLEKCCSEDPSFREPLSKCMEFTKFTEDMGALEMCISDIRGDDWKQVTNKRNIKTESKGSGNDFLTRCTLLVDAPLIQVLPFLSEIELVPTWVDVLKQVTVFESPSRTRKFARYNFWFPWPLSDRECMLEFAAFPIVSEKAICIVMRSPKSDNYMNFDIPPPAEGKKRMFMNIGCLYAQVISPTQTKIIFIAQANANIFLLPRWLINFGTKHIMYYLMDTLRNKILNFQGSIYEEKMNEKRDFYEFMHRIVEQKIDARDD
ncbi:unnamed protein product [Blepharisma stoltei]|uniref:START domain-containing protein n=1 Tax=Blepharisma stoltei TaxID=1481888 RepID=A0AAU9J3P9_9CILI|nr:unnamed protein product [Blepharisma stoltei]